MPLRRRPTLDSEERERVRLVVYEFETMVKRVHPLLVAYARRRLFDHADVDDVVAETLATTWYKWSDVPHGDHELAYLYGIERRVVANHWRSLRRQQSLIAQLKTYRPGDGDAESRTDRESLVAAALGRLRRVDQEILTLAYRDGRSACEIGIALGCSENAATIRLHRARKLLKDRVRDAYRIES